MVRVDYVAFYQPTSCDENYKWCIERFAPVRGHELVTRAELIRDEPDYPKAGEENFKIQWGPLQKLANPSQNGKRELITFFYTTGDYFLQAKSVSDLVVHSEERKLLWQSLCERAEHDDVYKSQM